MKKTLGIIALCFGFIALAEGQIHRARYLETDEGARTLLDFGPVPGNPDRVRRALEQVEYPRFIAEHAQVGGGKIVELRSTDEALLRGVLQGRRVAVPEPRWEPPATDEVITLISNGPPANRIDLVFMGDGYTQAERQKFLDDVSRLVKDFFEGDTFKSYHPVFNVHAVFRASAESGIGKNDTPRNTAYRLYRVGNTLRAIMPGDTFAASSSCRKAPDCDYPILVANDPYYGGLGGQFAITTSSLTSGAMVLRHELGHNFGRVGEEYDGQEATFFGANFSTSLTNLNWRHWLTGPVQAEPMVAHFIDWPWKNLGTGDFTAKFRSPGTYAYSAIRFSASGTETDADLEVTLDGNRIPFKSPGHSDRVYHDLAWNHGFPAGDHELRFSEGVNDGNTYLSSLTIHEYGAGFHFDDKHIGAYPMFTKSGKVAGYRATNETCLMRNMTSTRFCPICQENNWLKFFATIGVIDGVKVDRNGGKVKVAVQTPPLDHLVIRWYRDGSEVPALAGAASWERPEAEVAGRWEVAVEFRTPEVKKDPSGLLKGRRKFTI